VRGSAFHRHGRAVLRHQPGPPARRRVRGDKSAAVVIQAATEITEDLGLADEP
jgi:hypothetical protein